jgi:tetratricopeptide (TPR) repeat protein
MKRIILTTLILIASAVQTFAANDSISSVPFIPVDSLKNNQIIVVNDKNTDSLLISAEKLFLNKNYTEAGIIYNSILKARGESFDILFNLGNCYYKSNEIPSAILSYERALKINPGDRDARFNLKLCQNKIVDKIDPVGVFLFTRIYDSIGNLYNSNTWSVFGIIFFAIFIAALLGYFFSRISWLKKLSFYGGLLSIILTILAVSYSAKKYNEAMSHNQAILFTPTVTIKSSPDQSGTDLFVLHEGTKVQILSEIGDWKEIGIEDGNVGWIQSDHLVII